MRRLLIGAALLGLAADAQNLVKNPGFAADLAGWTTPLPPHTAAWSPLDARGAAGSAFVTNAGVAGETNAILSQCVDGIPAGSYTFRGRFRIAPGQAAAGFASLSITTFAGEDCGGFSERHAGSPPPRPGEWQTVTLSGVPISVPEGSALIEAIVTKESAGGTLDVSFDDFSLVPSRPRTLTLPASASRHGAAGAFFHSDLWLFNRSFGDPLQVTATLRCLTGLTCGSGSAATTLAPRASTLVPDALATLLGAAESAGALELSYDAAVGELSATSRVYTPSLPAPTNGAAVPALAPEEARTRALFLGLGHNGGSLAAGFRSNAGAYNPSEAPVTLTFALTRGDGTALGSPYVRTWAAHEAFQINDVFTAAGAAGEVTANAALVVTATAPVFAYVTVIDNQSGDSIYVLPSEDEAPPPRM